MVVQTAYLLFRLHNVMPSDFYQMGYGEKAIVAAFLEYEVHQESADGEGYGMGEGEEVS